MPNGGKNIAFVFVNIEIGREEETIKEIEGYDGVRKAQMFYGVYSAVIEIDSLKRDVVKRIIDNGHMYTVTVLPVAGSFQ